MEQDLQDAARMRWLFVLLLVACGHPSAAPPGEQPPDGKADGNGSDTTDAQLGDGAGRLVWAPHPGTSWQWQLQGTIDTSYNVEMYDIDLFDVPQSTIDGLHAAGRRVICYFSAG